MFARAEAAWRQAKALSSHRRMRSLTTGLTIVFSSVFLGGMLWYYLPTLLAYHWEINLAPIMVGCMVYALHLFLSVLGWSMIMQQLGVRIGFREHFKIYCLTRIAGRIPGAPWHLVGRAVLYKRLEVSNSVMGVATGLEMLLVVVSGLLSGILVWFVLPPTTQMQFIWLGPILFIGVILTHPTFIQRILKKLGQGEVGVHLRYRDILLVLVVFVVGWAAGGIVLYLAILALYPLSLTQLPAVIGAWGISGAVSLLVFFSPTAFGIKEITLSLILSLLVPGGLAILVTILMRLFLTAAEFVAAILASRL